MTVFPRKLQLGSFDHTPEGWLNTDITPHLFVARVLGLPWLLHHAGMLSDDRYASHRSGAFRSVRYLDVSRPFRFPDSTFEAVLATHVLEHLPPDAAERCLRETHRVLAPGGILRVAVPDLDVMVANYDPAEPDRFLWGIYQGRSADANWSARHWWQYNATSLEQLLRRTGFRDIQRCEFRDGRLPDVERVDMRPGSLFVEAMK
jgi:SAM-dependent methyltransferase